jgi:hypothetical protein
MTSKAHYRNGRHKVRLAKLEPKRGYEDCSGYYRFTHNDLTHSELRCEPSAGKKSLRSWNYMLHPPSPLWYGGQNVISYNSKYNDIMFEWGKYNEIGLLTALYVTRQNINILGGGRLCPTVKQSLWKQWEWRKARPQRWSAKLQRSLFESDSYLQKSY